MPSFYIPLDKTAELAIAREEQTGPYVVSETQLQTQLLEAQSLLRPTKYQKVTVLHLVWNTEEDLQAREPGIEALSKVFEDYGFNNRLEKIPTSARSWHEGIYGWSSDAAASWLAKLAEQVYKTHGKDDLVIVHYRGRACLSDDHSYRRKYLLQSGIATELDESTFAVFGSLWWRLDRYAQAQVVYLMDCNYPLDLDSYPSSISDDRTICRTFPVIAASSIRPQQRRPEVQPEEPKWHTGKKRLKAKEAKEAKGGRVKARVKVQVKVQVTVNNDFNQALVNEFRNALNIRQFHSTSTLYSALRIAGLTPFSTKAHFERKSSPYLRDNERCSPCFAPVGSPDANSQAVVEPSMRQLTVSEDSVVVVVRVAIPASPDSSALASNLRTWLADTSTPGFGPLSTMVEVSDDNIESGFLKLKLSRALWHCFPPYRGWAEEIDGVLQPEGQAPYYEKDLKVTWRDPFEEYFARLAADPEMM